MVLPLDVGDARNQIALLRHDPPRMTVRLEEARNLLGPIYGWFREAFDISDLKSARALLDEPSWYFCAEVLSGPCASAQLGFSEIASLRLAIPGGGARCRASILRRNAPVRNYPPIRTRTR